MVSRGVSNSRPWLLPSLTVGAGLVGWLLVFQVLHGGGSADPLKQLATLVLAVVTLSLCGWSLVRWRRQLKSRSHARHRMEHGKLPSTYRETKRRSAVVFLATAPAALVAAVLAGPSPWMSLIFALMIGVPQLIIWFSFLKWPGNALPNGGFGRH